MLKKLKDELFYTSIFHYLVMILMAGLFIAGLVLTGSNPNVYDEFVSLGHNNPLTVYLMLVSGGMFFLLCKILYDKLLYKVNDNIIMAVFMAAGLILSLVYVFTTYTKPQADALSLSIIASEVNAKTSGVYAYDSYIGVYSHQVGFVTVLRLIYAIFGDSNYRAVQVLFSLNVPLIMLAGCNIISLLQEGENKEKVSRSRFYYLLITFGCIPMYMYVLFVYGDIAYTGLTMLAAWILLSDLKRFSLVKSIGFGIVCAVEYLCKSNSLIVIIAFAVVLILSIFSKEKRKASIILLASLFLFLMILPKLNDLLYKDVLPGTDAMPSLAWVAMGMNDDYERAGWCNFYNQIVFAECGYDAAATKVQCLADIKAVLGVWVHNPGYFLDFINRKINLQWNTPLYQGIVMNNSFEADRQVSFAKEVYQNPNVQKHLENFMKVFQLWMYGSIFAMLTINRRQKKEASYYVLLIAVFGGFLFSVLWEAKTRYIFPYLIMTLPYFALGVERLSEWTEESKFIRLLKTGSSETKQEVNSKEITEASSKANEKEALATNNVANASYNGLDIFKLVMAVFVIVIHTVPYMGVKNQLMVKAIESALATAVPFFFITAGFLMGNKLFSTSDTSLRVKLLKKYFWRMTKLYLVWTLVYTPLAIYEYIQSQYSLRSSILFYLRGLLFTGEHFNSWMLWYLLSTIIAILFLLGLSKLGISLETVIVAGFGFFIFANFAQYVFEECYFEPQYAGLIKLLTYTFYVCKVFKGLFYFPLGIWLSKHGNTLRKSVLLTLIGYLLSAFAGFGEAAVVITSIGLFGIASNMKIKDSSLWIKMRKMSTVTYFMHMLVYTAVYMILAGHKSYNLSEFLITAFITLLIAWTYSSYEQKINEVISKFLHRQEKENV